MDSATLFAFAGLASWFADQKESTELNLRQASEQAPGSLCLLLLYARSCRWRGHPWQQLEVLERHKNRFNNSFWYWASLGRLQMSMYRLSAARSSLERAVTLRKRSARTWWRLGQVLEGLGELDAGCQAYAQAIAQSWNPSVRLWGVGVWFAQEGLWEQAVQAYALQIQQSRPRRRVQLLIRSAQAHEHLLDWGQASNDYRLALQLAPRCGVGERLAWAYARKEQWSQAQAACQTALQMAPIWPLANRRHLRRLLALCLHQQSQPREATEQFALAYRTTAWWQRSLLRPVLWRQPEPRHRAHAQQAYPYIERARRAWAQRDWAQAAACFGMAVQCWPVHTPRLFAVWGHVLAEMGAWDAACHAFRQAHLYRWPVDAVQRKLERKQAQRRVMEYTEYLETLPIQSRTVVYESYAGISVSCNPYAIYRGIVDDPQFAGWLHVWVLNDLGRIPEECADRANVVFVARDSQLYQRYLATAGWLINNSTFPSYFIRRNGQKYLNTWHGTPFKTLGKDIRRNFMEHKNTARNLLHATHVLSPNLHTSQVLIERNDIADLYQGQLAQIGYPRNDLLLNASASERAQFREKLGLPPKDKPLVLYAPTWRGILGHPEVDSQKLIADLHYLQQQDCQIVFRGHYFAENALRKADLKNVHIAPQAIDTSELLAITDVLITDYSSIFFDYLPTGRPLLFYTYDLAQYSQERGLYFDMAEVPAPNCATVQQLSSELSCVLAQIRQGSWQPAARYRAAQQQFNPCEDGQATGRAIDFFFKDNDQFPFQPKQDKRKTLLFFVGPFTPMGITTAAINLISALDAEQYCIVVAIDPEAVGSQTERMERLGRLPAHVRVIARVGRQVCSPQERSVIDSFHRHDRLNAKQWTVYATAFQREFRRVFGDWQPTNVINYDGYARFWAGLLAFGPQASTQRLLYLHNDMHGEWQVRFPHLAGMFALYPKYDLLVSVAEAISQANRKHLAVPFGIQPERFVHADNMPDFEGVRAKAQEPLNPDLEQWLKCIPVEKIFVCIGRLSPEKNHKLLLSAFAEVIKKHPQARLVILGEGVLREALEKQVVRQGLKGAVLLPGVFSNPFPLLSRSGCFVLPSKHEGQPMVLLEAMILNKPIVATNIPGVRELLVSGCGTLVNFDPVELAQALINKIENSEKNTSSLDFSNYKEKVLRRFYELLENFCKDK